MSKSLLVRSAVAVLAAGALVAVPLAVHSSSGKVERGARALGPSTADERSELSRKPSVFRPIKAPFAATDGIHAVGDPTFGQPTIVGIQGNGFEQDIRLHPSDSDVMYTSAPASLSSDTSFIWHSTDGGRTFKWVRAASDKEGKPMSCPGGGDTELAVDGAGRVYFNDLTLANFSVARSDDGGATFPCSPTGVPDQIVDRQWYAIDGDPVGQTAPAPSANSIYLTNDEFAQGHPLCGGGPLDNILVLYRSPLSPLAGANAGLTFGPPNRITCDEGIMGNNEVSPVATTTGEVGQPALATPVRHVYIPFDNAALNAIKVARCFPVAFAPPVPNVSDPSGTRCNVFPVTSFPGSKTGANFPTMAIDNAGNLYMVWEQAPLTGAQAGDTALMYSYSTDEGVTWSTPISISPLPNNVFGWIAAGDDGRVDVMFMGTNNHVDLVNGGPDGCDANGGPDSVNGIWSIYMVQSLNAHAATPTFTAPILAGEHFIRRGSQQTLIGGQCGNRSLGDFFQLRIGDQGEAHISFADSNNRDAVFLPHAMYVRQNGGNGLYANATVTGDPILQNSASDPLGDGIYEAGGVASANSPSLDIVSSTMSMPNASDCHPAGTACYRVEMTVNNLSATPMAPAPDADTSVQWLTQWLVPSHPSCVSNNASCALGGANFMVYAESTGGGAIQCFSGQNAGQLLGGGVVLTYPGTQTITATDACKATTGANGKITIDVPVANVTLAGGVLPLDNKLYSVTASTTTSNATFSSVPPQSGIFTGPIGGVLFNVIDVNRSYDAQFTPTAVTVRSFRASARGRSVELRWQTGTESRILGFNLFGARGEARVRLNAKLIHAANGLRARTYVWRGKLPSGVGRTRFWLQAVGHDGSRTWVANAAVARR